MSSIATTNETSNITSFPTAPKPQTGKEVIAANVKLLIEQIKNRGKQRPKHVMLAPKLIVRDSVRRIDRPNGRTERQAG